MTNDSDSTPNPDILPEEPNAGVTAPVEPDNSVSAELAAPVDVEAGPDADEESLETDRTPPRREQALFALKFLAIGALIGVILGGAAYLRLHSVQASVASKLIKNDSCLSATTSPSGFCFNAPVSVRLKSANPVSQLVGLGNEAVISSPQARIGLFGNSILNMEISGITGGSLGSGATLTSTKVGSVSGSFSLAYKALTQTLQSGAANAASIYYYGKNEIGTSNVISYQGKQIPLVVVSKISLKNGVLYLAPVTVSALGHTAPASSVFSNTAPVPVTIPTLPKGARYTGIVTNKKYLVFSFKGSNINAASLFNAK